MKPSERHLLDQPIVGMRRQRTAIDQALRAALERREAQALQLTGAGGSGKTMLVRYAAASAPQYRCLRVTGRPAERSLELAGLNAVIRQMLDGLDAVHPAHRDALSVVAGTIAGPMPDHQSLYPAFVELLSALAERNPVLLAVDDADLLDGPSLGALTYAARRPANAPLVMLLATSREQASPHMADFREIEIGALADNEARDLVREAARRGVDDAVLERILGEARGNPRALVTAVTRESFDGDLTNGFATTVPSRQPRDATTAEALAKVELLGSDARELLLVAAADPTGDPALFWAAASLLGLRAELADTLCAADLLEAGDHILVNPIGLRSAIYSSASPVQRRRVHGALARVTGSRVDQQRRVWHQALATVGLDNEVAAAAELSAQRAAECGGLPAKAAFLQAATLLTADPELRAQRAVAAANAKYDVGAADAAQRLLSIAEMGPHDDQRSAHVALARARSDASASLPAQARRLIESAEALALHDPQRARDGALEALTVAQRSKQDAQGSLSCEIAQRAEVLTADESAHPTDLLLTGLIRLTRNGFGSAFGSMRRAVAAFGNDQLDERAMRWVSLASVVALNLGEDSIWVHLASRDLNAMLSFDEDSYRMRAAGRAFLDMHDVGRPMRLPIGKPESSGWRSLPVPLGYEVFLAAWRGGETLSEVIDPLQAAAVIRSDDGAAALLAVAAAIRENSLGNYEGAARLVADQIESDQLAVSALASVELVEAASRVGDKSLAVAGAEKLSTRAGLAGSHWALGAESLAQALIEDGAQAEDLFLNAIDHLTVTVMRPYFARANLLYGEWLRRRNRRLDARGPLHAAHDAFLAMGAQIWAERAGSELLATGQTARKRSAVGRTVSLTPQEHRIASLARDGLSNSEIGSQLFVSPRTVEYHLRKVFGKLGISSRNELHLVLRAAVKGTRILPVG